MSLLFKFHQLAAAPDQRLELIGTIAPPDAKLRTDVLHIDPFVIQAKAVRADGAAEIQGFMRTQVEFVCGRCLKQHTYPVKLEIREWFVRQGTEVDTDQDEDHVHIIEGDLVDVTEAVHEQFWLTLPLIPLCEEDCKGLCPQCGVDRNTSSCTCDTRRIDPRMADLQKWFNDSE